MTAKELIKELQKIVDKQGDKIVHVYKGFDQSTVKINGITFDKKENDIYLSIYN